VFLSSVRPSLLLELEKIHEIFQHAYDQCRTKAIKVGREGRKEGRGGGGKRTDGRTDVRKEGMKEGGEGREGYIKMK
jgi:hypothetical protein